MAATNKRGVFSLEKVLERQSDNNWSNIFDPFRYVIDSSFGTDYGYFGGGTYNTGGNSSSIIQRIDFNNDTANSVTKGNETVTAQNRGGTSSTSYGYLGGGNDPAYVSTVDRIDYSNDATTASPKGPLTLARARASGTHNSDYGYQGGGYAPASPNYISTVDRIDFSNDTATAVAKGPLTGPKNATIAVGNQSYGYWAGGTFTPWPTFYTSVDRLDYSSDTTATAPKGNLTRARAYTGGAGNASYGYIGAGYFDPGPYTGSTMDRIDYSNDTAAAVPAGPYLKSSNSWNLGATGNTSYGYWAGDERNADGSEIGRLDYSNDTQTTTQVASLSGYMQRICGFSSRANANPTSSRSQATRIEANSSPAGTNFGYAFGGTVKTGGPLNYTIQRIDFANDTATASVPSSMTNTSPSNAGNAGGFAVASLTHAYAGQSPNPSASSSIQRLDLSNDTTNASVHANMPETAFQTNGVGNSDYGYICGNDKTSTSRIDYSNDTATTSPKGDLTVERGSAGVTGTPSYGYVGSGWKSNFFTQTSKTDRIDYSNDTATAVVVGNMTFSKHNPTAAGNLSYGWFNQGGPGLNTRICRLDYSSDTTNAVQKGSLSASTYGRGATGDQSYGYFAGGFSPSPSSHQTVVCRIDYANDTPTSSTKGPLTTGVFYGRMASSKANGLPFLAPKTVDKGADGYAQASFGPAFGYYCGGMVAGGGGTNISTVERIDFDNDTATASTKGPLSSTRHSSATVGTTSFGYACGGPSPSDTSTVDRVDYANDTAAMTVVGPLESPSSYNSAVYGNASYGYIKASGASYSNLTRLEYANDSATSTPKGNLTNNAYALSQGTGTNSYGYLAGGYDTNSINNRIDYSNDTATATPKGNLTQARYAMGATSNSSYGYFGGGAAGPISRVDRLDFANDSTTMVQKGSLSSARNAVQATGSPSYGYFAGGNSGPGTPYSTIDRIDFSNDTPTASPKGALTAAKRYCMGVSSQGNGLTSTPTIQIPRIRWVDSAAEVPISSLAPSFGYFQNGTNNKTVVERLDFDNDTETLVAKGNLSEGRKDLATVGNTSYGYFAAGYVYPDPSPGSRHRSTVDRLDYSNDTTNAVAKGPVRSRYNVGGTGNASYGYVVGGDDGSGISRTWVDRIDYGNDTATASPKGDLNISPGGRKKQGCVGNMSFGYFTGGTNGGSYFTHINRIDYSNDTATAPTKGNLSIARDSLKSTGNASFGYCIGGYAPSLSSPITTVDRIDYSNDTAVASVRGSLTQTVTNHGATGSPSFGYAGAGGGNLGTRIDRIDYNNDTATAVTKSTTPSPGANREAVGPRINGLPPTDSLLAPVQPPFPYPQQLFDPNFGYWVGGQGSPSYTSTVDRVDWATDTGIAATKGPLSTPWVYYNAAVASPSYGYVGGGARSTGPSYNDYSTVIDRIDFTNDSATATPKGNLSGGKNRLAATGNASYGYFGGGFVQNPSIIDRVDYGNDTATATPKGNLNNNRWAPAATGNQSYGYFCSGMNTTDVDRVEYANDTPNASPKGKLNNPHNYGGATGNASYGYVGGGQGPSPSKFSSIDRIDYSNDTATSVLKGPLSAAMEGTAATGNQSYGWWAGGQVPPGPLTSRIDRLDFYNDTTTASPRGILSQKRGYLGATSPTANANPN